MMYLPGSYQQGFAPRDFEPQYPELWRGCVGAWAPCLGPTGTILRDWCGTQNHATLTNMVTNDDWVTSQGRFALDLDGLNDYLTAAALTLTTHYSISTWARVSAITASPPTISQRSSTTGNPVLFQLNFRSTGDFLFVVRDNAGNAAAATGGSSSLNTWTHLGGVRTGNSVALYVNGVLVGTGTATLGTITANTLLFGALNDSVSIRDFLPGQIDDYRVYGRSLSASEMYLLSRRRGIAFEPRIPTYPKASQLFNAAWAKNSNQLISAGVI